MTPGDVPKSLSDTVGRERRNAFLREPHVAPLTAFVEALRLERGVDREIPFFDPLDGGVNAEVLFVLEAPGPGAVASGFISRNNPDESAKNWFLANQEAGLPREKTVTWNIVPWYIGDGSRIRGAQFVDINAGWQRLLRLLPLLPRLRAVVLVGQKAQVVRDRLQVALPLGCLVFTLPHPSPRFVNRRPENWGRLVEGLRVVSSALR